MIQDLLAEALASGSIMVYILIFIAGIAASFTPCTYPVLPMTVGFLGNAAGGSRKKAAVLSIVMVLGMALVYAVVGTVTSALGSQMGALWAKGWVVYLIAIFFIAMALFLMDVFTFPTPRFLMNIQAKASKPREGYLGAFMVGAVSGLVVGPCTGPIIGTVLAVVATSLEKAEGIEFVIQSLSGGLKLFVFGFGQGTLIILCGIFAGFLSKLPKSGAWMVTFKKVFASIIILGATLLLVYAGQETDFPRLTNLLAQAESSSGVEDGSSGEVDNKNNINTETGNNSLAGENSKGDNGDSESKYGGDEFLE